MLTSCIDEPRYSCRAETQTERETKIMEPATAPPAPEQFENEPLQPLPSSTWASDPEKKAQASDLLAYIEKRNPGSLAAPGMAEMALALCWPVPVPSHEESFAYSGDVFNNRMRVPDFVRKAADEYYRATIMEFPNGNEALLAMRLQLAREEFGRDVKAGIAAAVKILQTTHPTIERPDHARAERFLDIYG
jgi:hypothetical protein